MIAGAVVGSVVGAALLGALAFFLIRRRRLQRQADVEVFQPQYEGVASHDFDHDHHPSPSWISSSHNLPSTPASMSQPMFSSRSSLPPPPTPQHRV